MNIWLMNHYATAMFADKAGRHYWFAKGLEKLGYSVTVFCASTIINKAETINTEGRKWICKKSDNTPFVFVKVPQTFSNGLDRVKNMGAFYFGLFTAAKQYSRQTEKPDVIVASSVHPLTMAAGIQIAKKMRIPCICEIRDLWPEAIFAFGKAKEQSILGRVLVAGEHWIYRKADALIFTKEGDTDYLRERGWLTEQGGDISIEKCHYINNGVDIDSFEKQSISEVKEDCDLEDDNKFNVIYTGTIRPMNNVGNLLDTAKIISDEQGYEDVQFLIYGDGSELPGLRKRVEDEKIDNVKIKGSVEKRYIPYILSKSSVNVLNYSQKEYNWTRGNSSNKLFEYMASGKPVISTVRMGYSIVDRYNCGVELDEDTPEALARQIMKFQDMSKEERDKIGKNAKEGAKDFDFRVLTGKLVKVIESVI